MQQPGNPLAPNILTTFSVQFAPTTKFTVNGTGFQSTVLNGTYNGSVTDKADGTVYGSTLIFSGQNTSAGTIQGNLTIPTYLNIKTSGTFTGSVAATGKFTFTRKTSLATATLTGQESSDGKTLTGTLTYVTLFSTTVFTFSYKLA